MKRYFIFILTILFFLPLIVSAQRVTYSDYENDDGMDINFEIIGKMNGNFLVYKNYRWKHKLCIFDNNMNTTAIIKLDFLPEKTLNVDFITYPDFFYMIYQYQKRSIVHCMGVKMDGNGNKLGEPIELDTTQLSMFSDNKIYSTIFSEDKQHIMVFKIQKHNETMHMVTLLFDNQLKLQNKSRMVMNFNERQDRYGDFLLDNEANLVFTLTTEPASWDYANVLHLVTKTPLKDSLIFYNIDLKKNYVDEVKIKVDNLNQRYIINSFIYKKNHGSVDGLFSCSWDKITAQEYASNVIGFSDSLRAEARKDGHFRNAMDDFVIRQIIDKKDGGFLLITEDFTAQTSSNNNNLMNRGYYNNPFYSSPFYSSPFYYNPFYNGYYYRPYNSFNSLNSTRYYYANILVMSMDKNCNEEWNKVIHKDQFDDNEDNFLSYSIMNSGGEIHFLFNADKKNEIISDESITPGGSLNRNATLKSEERGYQFMTKLSKQVGARQLIIPCQYRGYICFAKVEL